MPTLTLACAPAAHTTRSADGLARALAIASSRPMRVTGTAGHSRRVAGLAARIAAELGRSPSQIARIRMAGLVHDVGKAWIPERVLQKPGLLTPSEWLLIEAHPLTGAGLLTGAGDVARWVLTHHERPDGRGYPNALLLDDIPAEARILAVADAFDAMVSARPGSMPVDRSVALEELRANADSQFDAEVVAAFSSTIERNIHRGA